jgi:hypothetical protein
MWAAAFEVLSLVAEGQPVPELKARELADAVLANPTVKLALAVRDGGPHTLDRVTELAAILVSDAMRNARSTGGHAG